MRQFTPLLVSALLAPAAPAAAQEVVPAAPITLEHRMLLRCSAAFALVARDQAGGDAAALAYPPMAHDGREFFVRASAQVMDEAGLDREALARELEAQARELAEGDMVARIMPACIPLLDGGNQ